LKIKLTEEQIELVKKFSDCRKRMMKLCATFPDSMILTNFQRVELHGLTSESEDIAFEISCSLEKSLLGD
jgi:hypothetical protein